MYSVIKVCFFFSTFQNDNRFDNNDKNRVKSIDKRKSMINRQMDSVYIILYTIVYFLLYCYVSNRNSKQHIYISEDKRTLPPAEFC